MGSAAAICCGQRRFCYGQQEQQRTPQQARLRERNSGYREQKVYVRRLVDVRTVDERRYSVKLKANPGKTLRLPVRDYVIADTINPNGYGESVRHCAAEDIQNDPQADVNVELRYSNKPSQERSYDPNFFYCKGDVVLQAGGTSVPSETQLDRSILRTLTVPCAHARASSQKVSSKMHSRPW